ncbi:MAG: hypothetical protein JWO06_782 [Bacteroidota bacterium]|nr:hypothetical protein [Bacteroidota bacterium]
MKVTGLFLIFLIGFNLAKAQQPADAFKLGLNAYNAADYPTAIKYFSTAISGDPSRSYFYYNRGMALKANGSEPQALSDFTQSINLKPTAEAYYQAGLIKYKKDDMAGARTEFENAKTLRDDFDNVNFYLGMIYFKDKNYDGALKCYADYTSHIKTNADAFYYRGFCEAKLGQFAQALMSLKAALIYKDRDWKFYYKMYEVNLALGDKQSALNNLSMIIEMGEGKAEQYEARAKLYHDIGYDFKAEEDSVSAVRLKEGVVAQ